ncbi:MAG: sigma-70 family RNA polymerase sigma factor [Planctomycetota bacterium]
MTGNTFEFELQRLLAEEPFVRRLARGLLFDEHRVDDVVQQTWIAALRNPPRADGTGAAGLRGWIAGVVRRLAANEVRGEVRRRRREAVVEVAAETVSADQVLAREELRHQVVEALQGLGEPYRTVVALRYLEGLEPAAIATRLGVPSATVRTQVRRGLDQMREQLDRRHGGDRGAWCSALVSMVGATRDVVGGGAVGALHANKLLWATLVAAALLLGVWAWWPDPALLAPQTGERAASSDAASATSTAPLAAATGDRSAVVTPPTGAPVPGAGSMRGRLLGPDRQPLGAAQLDAFAFDGSQLFGSSAELPSVAARTDDDGTFVLDGLPLHASVLLRADVGGALQQLVPLVDSPAPGRVVELGDVVLEARGALTGTVVDEDGRAVAGAEVWSADLPSLVLAAMPVDRLHVDDGVLVMVPRPDAAQCADAEKWQDAVRSHLAFRVVTTDYGAQPDAAWLPMVVDTAPFASLWRRLPFARATSDAAGHFELRGVALGDNLLVAGKAGMATAVRQRVAVRDSEPRDVGELTLAVGETAEGAVVDASGAPVEGAEVRVVPLGLFGFRGVAPSERAVVTNAQGRFAVPGLARGQVMVAWRGSAREPWRCSGPHEVDDELTLTLPAAVSVPLHFVVPEGFDAGAVRVSARPTPPLGELSRFGCVGAFEPLPLQHGERGAPATVQLAPGVHTLRCELDGAAPIVRLVDVDAVTDPLELVFARAPELTIVVQDARGAPVADAEVFVQPGGDPDARSVMAARYGVQTFDDPWPLPPSRSDADGRVVLRTVPGPVRVSARRGRDGAAARTVDVAADARITLQLAGTGAIVGRVGVGPTASGKPGDYRVTTRLHWEHRDLSPVVDEAGARPGTDGRFRFDGLTPGRHTVRLLDPLPSSLTFTSMIAALRERTGWGLTSVREVQVEVRAGEVAEAEFRFGGLDRSLGSVHGVVRFDGVPASGCTVWRRVRELLDSGVWSDSGWDGRAAATIAADGSFVVGDLPLGTCWLGVREGLDGEFVHAIEVEVAAGEPVPVIADVQFGRVNGRVRRHDGSVAAGVRLHVLQGRGDTEAMLGWSTDTDAEGRFSLPRVPVGEHRVSLHQRHDRIDPTPLTVFAGAATPPLELTCDVVHRLRVTLAADVALPTRTMTLFGLRRVGDRAFSSYAGYDREHEFAVDGSGDYEVILRIDGVWTLATPSPIPVLQLDEVVEVRPGAPFEPK